MRIICAAIVVVVFSASTQADIRTEIWSLVISDCMLRTPYHLETVKQMGEDRARNFTLDFAG